MSSSLVSKESNENIPKFKYESIPDVFLSLDLEMNQPSGEIIEIGACVFSKTSGILETRNWIVKPEFELSKRIIDLTGITEDMVLNGVNLLDAYEDLVSFRNSHHCFINPIVWGHGDVDVLQNQTGLFGDFGRRVIDVKTLCVFDRIKQNKPLSGGLAKTLGRYGLKFQGKKHRAGFDALNTARLFLHILNG